MTKGLKMIKLFHVLAVLLPLATINGFNIHPKIINGIISEVAEFKFFVFIESCGAGLISDRWVLTAGHCVQDNVPITAYFGLNESNEFSDMMEIPVANQHLYPGYIDALYPSNDIGLIELPRKVELNAYIQPVKLSNKCGTDLDNIDVIAIGNGRTSFLPDSYTLNILRHIYLTTLPSDDCKSRMAGLSNDTYAIMCAEPNKGASIFNGDSGGPLIQNGALIGITSFLDGKISPPVVHFQAFTRIHAYFDWIQEVTGIEMPKCRYN